MFKIIITLLAMCFCTIAPHAQQFTTPVRVNSDASGSTERAPTMHLDQEGNVIVLWVKGGASNTDGDLYAGYSTDKGASFSPSIKVCSNAKANSAFQRGAQFAVDTKGTIHVVWAGNRVNNQPDVWYVRSDDHGKSWTQPITVCDADDSSKYAQDFPSIACDSNDNLYVSFLDMRESGRQQSLNTHLYFTKSIDGGMIWSKNKKVEILPNAVGGTCECCAERIAVSNDGNIYIVFRSNISDLRNIWLARSYNKGDTFEPSLKIQSGDWILSACPVSGPNLVLDADETAHIVWHDARNDSADDHLYYAAVNKNSNQTPMNIAFDALGATSVNYADVAVYGNGYRAIVYQSFNYGIRYLLYDPEANTLVNNRPLPNGSSQEFASVLFAPDGTRYLCWEDANRDGGDILFSKETTPLTQASVPTMNDNKGITIYPNPVKASSPTISIATESFFASKLELFDLLGNKVFQTSLQSLSSSQIEIRLPSLSKGFYNCILSDANGSRSSMLILK